MNNSVTYIVPHRNLDEYRERNIRLVLDWIRLLKYDKEIIVVEQDDKPKMTFEKDVKHIFIKNAGQFSKSWAMNVGIREASNELIVMCDSDCFFNVDKFNLFLDKMLTGKYKVGTPNHYNFTRLKIGDTQRIHESLRTFNEPRQDKEIGAALGGGCFAATRTALYHVKLWDEDFRGWGGEDTAIGSKFFKEGWTYDSGDALRMDNLGYHLWHPAKGDVEGYMTNKEVNANLFTDRYVNLPLPHYKNYLKKINIRHLGYRKKYENE